MALKRHRPYEKGRWFLLSTAKVHHGGDMWAEMWTTGRLGHVHMGKTEQQEKGCAWKGRGWSQRRVTYLKAPEHPCLNDGRVRQGSGSLEPGHKPRERPDQVFATGKQEGKGLSVGGTVFSKLIMYFASLCCCLFRRERHSSPGKMVSGNNDPWSTTASDERTEGSLPTRQQRAGAGGGPVSKKFQWPNLHSDDCRPKSFSPRSDGLVAVTSEL